MSYEYEELRDAVAKAIGSPTFHDQPPGEHWWENLFDDHRYPYRVKADAAISVIIKEVERIRADDVEPTGHHARQAWVHRDEAYWNVIESLKGNTI